MEDTKFFGDSKKGALIFGLQNGVNPEGFRGCGNSGFNEGGTNLMVERGEEERKSAKMTEKQTHGTKRHN